MRHQKKTVKLGRTASHRNALLANQVVSLIEHSRIRTTLAKAKAVRPLAEKIVTLGKKGTLHARRTALACLRHNEAAVHKLFAEIAPRSASRNGGYTRIIKLGYRKSDAAPIAYLEWVDQVATEAPLAVASSSVTTSVPAEASEPAAEKPAKKPRAKKSETSEEAAPQGSAESAESAE